MIYSILFILLLLAEIAYFRIADHFNIIDKPNNRSSHTRITLRGGGIVFPIGMMLYCAFFGLEYSWFLVGLLLISTISFVDDVKPTPSWLRLPVHFVAMGLMFMQWDLFSMPWYFTLLSLIFCTGIINAFNFMDGINGITGGYSLVVLASLSIINRYMIQFMDQNLLLVAILSIIVFNLFNFRIKAKCFAGDVGAVSIAFVVLFSIGKLILVSNDFTYLLLLGLYGVDSILTIIHRLMLKENIMQPHRKHMYQIMANELKMPHLLVSGIYMITQAVLTAGFLLCEKRIFYFFGCLIVLSIVYIIFMKKNFHLHVR